MSDFQGLLGLAVIFAIALLASNNRRRIHLTFQKIMGWLFAPVAWLIGVPWDEAAESGNYIGIKTVLNEFVAFAEIGPNVDHLDRDPDRCDRRPGAGPAGGGRGLRVSIDIPGISGFPSMWPARTGRSFAASLPRSPKEVHDAETYAVGRDPGLPRVVHGSQPRGRAGRPRRGAVLCARDREREDDVGHLLPPAGVHPAQLQPDHVLQRAAGVPVRADDDGGLRRLRERPGDRPRPPMLSRLDGKGAVPIWFVSTRKYQRARADGVVTIGELARLHPLRGSARSYTEVLENDHDRTGYHFHALAAGKLQNGKPFRYLTYRHYEQGLLVHDLIT